MMKLALILAIIFSLAFFGCLGGSKATQPGASNVEVTPPEQTTPAQTQNANVAPEPMPCKSAKNVLETDTCFASLASFSNNASWCDRIYSIETRDACLSPFAMKDEKLCAKIAGASMQQDCYDSAARRLNSTDYCVKIGDAQKKDKCLRDLSPACTFEQTDSATKLCLALYHNDSSYCLTSQCLLEVGVQKNNLGACNKIDVGERALRSACRAIVLDDISTCNESGNGIVEDYCYYLAASRMNDSAWCTLASDGSPYRNKCIMQFAVQENDATLCRFASPEIERDNCYVNYSSSTGDYSACKSIITSIQQTECYLNTAMGVLDPTACNYLYYGTRKICYNNVLASVAPIKGGAATCAGISDVEPWQYKCYLKVAQDTKNKTICDLINDSGYKSNCEFSFQ